MVDGKVVGTKAQHMASSFQHYLDNTYTQQQKDGALKWWGIKKTPDDYVNWCRLRAKLGGCEANKSASVYRARGGACFDECAAMGRPGG